MKIGKTNAIFGGGVVYNFVPFVAPESFNDPRKYADYGLTVNLYEKFRIYKMTWADADIAVEFSDAIESVAFTNDQIGYGAIVEIFETVSGVEISTLRTTKGTHTFTSGSTKRYMIRRITPASSFLLPVGSVWAYCVGITRLKGYPGAANLYLKYVFFYENTLTDLGSFINTGILGTLNIPSSITSIIFLQFAYTLITKLVTSNNLTTINGTNASGAFKKCTNLLEADLGEGITSIGIDTFRDCTSLATIICRAETPPSIASTTFRNIPATTIFKVPADSLTAYQTATNWSVYASRIYAI